MRSREEIEKELQSLLDKFPEHANSIKLSTLIEIALDIRELASDIFHALRKEKINE